VGRLNRVHGRNEAEFAVVVSDEWQHHGLGTHLLEHLIQIGRAEKFDRITGTILSDNHAMLSVCEHLGFVMQRHAESGEFGAELIL
jgi:acetyltransferase